MFILAGRWDMRVMWLTLTLTAKFYVLCLLVGVVAEMWFIARTVVRLRSVHRNVAFADALRVKSELIEMTRGIENLRQFNTLLLLLFGICFANEAFATLR